MFKYLKKKSQENILYSKILFLSRNKLFYTTFSLSDTFQNRINLIFLHISFLLVRLKVKNKNKAYKTFSQKIFDFTFKNIELNMREIGHGDITVNKNMKFLVKIFYDILFKCENFKQLDLKSKSSFLLKFLTQKNKGGAVNTDGLVKYFDKYQAFCLDLSLDSVLKGDLNFNYN